MVWRQSVIFRDCMGILNRVWRTVMEALCGVSMIAPEK
jgi:hypothetical protein